MACSVHPYRADALRELERWARAGVRVCKWLPNSMGIDLEHALCRPFYRRLRELGLVLLTHVGDEHSVDAGFHDDALGNPLKLRGPLDMGVRVIAAHCASEGASADLDLDLQRGRDAAAGQARTRAPPRVDNFELFLRLMDEERYKGLLFGDISAIVAFKRAQYLPALLDRQDLHARLLFGSDYPVPAVYVVVWTSQIERMGLITAKERELLNRIWLRNPMLFDFVLKRCLVSKSGNKFRDCVFQVSLVRLEEIGGL
jgi:predicted TIM-barrel fold metal-dependent hydrolase